MQDFDSIGINLLKSLRQFVQLEAELEKELTSTKGWLKKSKLDELAGMTARNKLDINVKPPRTI